MKENWIPLSSIAVTGTTKTIEDQSFWESSLAEFAIPCRIIEPIIATLSILPQEDGILFRGSVTGTVAMPCNRCAEDTLVTIAHTFTSYEGIPADPYMVHPAGEVEEKNAEIDEAVVRLMPHGRGVEINPSALAWEEFSLALPVKPLCSTACKGLCPTCGCNRNSDACTCEHDPGDPRLAALRGLTLKKGTTD